MQGNPIFMEQAIALATENVVTGHGGPFGAVIVLDGEVLATGVNLVSATTDPTAHAEVVAIRSACSILGNFQLNGCHIYSSCEPCPMCLSAIYWSRCDAIFFGGFAEDAAKAGFDDAFLYDEVKKARDHRTIPTINLLREQAWSSFAAWREYAGRIDY
jgi:guanine deaminase